MISYKKIFLFVIFFIYTLIPQKSFAGSKYGNGELKLDIDVIYYFIQYIRGGQFRYPGIFYVTKDGTNATYWYCGERTNCQTGSPSHQLSVCRQQTGKECKAFARQRTIKWKNDINPGKGKISKINSKWTDQEIINKLIELGFYSN